MDNMKKEAEKLIDFIYKSPTAYQAVENVKESLINSNYIEIYEHEKWNLNKGGKYFITKNFSTIVAFEIGEGELCEDGFRIIGAHTDSPTFRIKPNNKIISENRYIKLNTEVYGGPIFSSWFDRPLGLAGKIAIKGSSVTKPKEIPVNINKPILIIPNLAIHFNREVNKGYEYNGQVDVLPMAAIVNEKLENEDYLLNLLEKELNIKKEEILDFELFLYEYDKGCIVGSEEEFISSSRLDDLWMVYAGLNALLESQNNKSVKVLICNDNEEVGSATAQGADSSFIRNILKRISIALGYNEEDFLRSLAVSMLISADLAHAVHPNYGDKHDPTNRPVLGKGPVIKYSSSQKYITTSFMSAVFKQLCDENNIPYQFFANRSDVVGGSTMARFLATNLAVQTLDMGAPVLGMHSVRELASVSDNYYTKEAFRVFYNA